MMKPPTTDRAHHGLALPRERLAEFCRRHHVKRLSLFGSILRDDFTAASDVDVLVEFEAGHTVDFFTLFDMEEELSDMLGGRRVEINTPPSLSQFFRDEVLTEAEVQYAQP
ncbi:MAG: nucleotidyltransferase family protein [Armatimonadia bacterium]